MTEFGGRTAWVLGAAGTIGAAVARRLARGGARVAVSGRQAEGLEALAKQAPDALYPLTADVTDEASVTRAAAEIGERIGPVDLLVVSVTVPAFGDFLELGDDAFERTMQTKYLGSLRCIRAVLPGMLARGFGRIVTISGGGGFNPRSVHLPGGGANAALDLVCRGLAQRYAGEGIRVNVVAPGPIRSPRQDVIQDAVRAAGGDETGRPVGTPEDVAEAAAYLLSPRSDFVNGAILRLDGGISKA